MTRKASMWAKAAGEYYRKNKGKNGIQSFSDVLKSDLFKKEYYAKYGKQGKTMSKKGSKLNKSKKMGGVDPGAEAVDTPEVVASVDTGAAPEVVASVDTGAAPEVVASVDTGAAPEVVASVDTGAALGGSAEIKKMGGKRKGKGKKRTAKKMSYKMW